MTTTGPTEPGTILMPNGRYAECTPVDGSACCGDFKACWLAAVIELQRQVEEA